MPQASLLSGVAGETRAYQGPMLGDQLVQMAEAFTRVKQAEKSQAMQKFQTMISTIGTLPIDAKAIRKEAKKAGIPLASDDEIAAIAAAGKATGGGDTSQAKSSTGAPQAGGQQPQGKQEQNPDAAAAAAQKKWQDSMTPQQGLQHVLDTWFARSQQLAQSKFKDEKAKLEYSTSLSNAKAAALGGDSEAMGKLMAAAEVPFNISQLAWQNSDPKQKETMYGLALGYETDAQRLERETSIFNGLLHSGLSAADAYSGSHAMGSGQPLSPELQKKMGAPSFEKLGKEADFMIQALQLGVPADKIQGVAATAMTTGSLIGALPKALQPVMQKELQLRQQQLNLEKERIGVEKTRASSEEKRTTSAEKRVDIYEKKTDADIKNMGWKHEAILAKLHLAEVTGENKEYLDSLKTMIQMKKNGVEPDPKELQKILDGLKSYGVDNETFQYLSGPQGTTTTPGSDPMTDELGGKK